MIPTLQVVKIQTAQLLTESNVRLGGSYGGGSIEARGAGFSDDSDEWDE